VQRREIVEVAGLDRAQQQPLGLDQHGWSLRRPAWPGPAAWRDWRAWRGPPS